MKKKSVSIRGTRLTEALRKILRPHIKIYGDKQTNELENQLLD
jgi:hypothetical protein